MKRYLLFAAFAFAAVPAFAQSQSPSAASSNQRHESTSNFAEAGGSAGQTARATGRGLEHGWQATKQGVTAEWNRATGDHADTSAK